MLRVPTVCCVSRIAGLREAIVASPSSALAKLSIDWLTDPSDLHTEEASAVLSRCEVLLGEPAVCGPLVDRCTNLVWLQSTFAGCNQLLTASSRRDYTATRLAGCELCLHACTCWHLLCLAQALLMPLPSRSQLLRTRHG